jgi:uncharacterized protein
VSKISGLTFIHSKNSKLKEISATSNLRNIKFTPSIFFPSGHMQTTILPFLKNKIHGNQTTWTYNYEREILELSDGGQIALDWVQPRDPRKIAKLEEDAPVLGVIPGLTGHNDDVYMVSTAMASVKNNYRLVIINHRGCSNSKLTTPKFYCAGTTNDLEQAVEYISSKFPNRKLNLLGFSMGANILANYLAKMGESTPAYSAM